MAKITVQNTPITVIGVDGDDYISLTDMAKSQLQEHIIFRWLSLKGTIEYLGEWEMHPEAIILSFPQSHGLNVQMLKAYLPSRDAIACLFCLQAGG